MFAKAQEYAAKFPGAVDLMDVAAVDELFASLSALEFVREETDDATGEPVVKRTRLQPYQIVALSNLNPPSADVARSLIPSLETLTDAELGEALTILRRASARAADVALTAGAAAGGLGFGAAGAGAGAAAGGGGVPMGLEGEGGAGAAAPAAGAYGGFGSA